MQVESWNLQTDARAGVDLPEEVYGVPYNEALLHQVVVAQLAGVRAGTAAQKNKSAVSGGGRKPWRQKGTGRARAGSIRSPLWRGGGKTFPASPRSYAQKVNRKMWSGAMRVALAELLRQGRLQVVENLDLEQPRTKLGRALMDRLGGDDVLVVLDEVPENLYLGIRNLPRVGICDWQSVGPVDLVGYGRVVMNRAAAEKLGETYA